VLNVPTINPTTQSIHNASVSIQPLPQSLSITVKKQKDKAFGITVQKETNTQYIQVTDINSESLFLNTALKVGHVIHSINGIKFTSFEEGTQIIKGFKEGKLTIEVSQTPTAIPSTHQPAPQNSYPPQYQIYPSNPLNPLAQRQEQQMHYDKATLESMSNEELCCRYQQWQQQQWQMKLLALQQQQQRQQTYQPPMLNQQQQCDGRKQQCQGGCGRMLGRNHFTENQWKTRRKCLECLLPIYTRLLGSIEKATEYIAQEMSVPRTSEEENGNKKICSRIVIPSPPELEEEFKAWLKENPEKEKEWEASKRVEQAQYEAVRVATNDFKPSPELIKKWDKACVERASPSRVDYMKEKYYRRYVLKEGLEGNQAYLPIICFDLHHNSAAAVKKKKEDKQRLGRSQPCQLTGQELKDRRHLLTMLPRTDHALETQ